MNLQLFSFRRCPYAIRARLALAITDTKYQLIEVDLKNKPEKLFELSPKGTVPVLITPNKIIDESLDIVLWSFQNAQMNDWIDQINHSNHVSLYHKLHQDFIPALNRFKYPNRYNDVIQNDELTIIQSYLQLLNSRLDHQKFLMCESAKVIDLLIFPFIRQLHHVDQNIVKSYPLLNDWLQYWLNDPQFIAIMKKNEQR